MILLGDVLCGGILYAQSDIFGVTGCSACNQMFAVLLDSWYLT